MSRLLKFALPWAFLGLLAMLAASPVQAQWRAPTAAPEPPAAATPPPQGVSRGENFSAGKSPAQLFASDCTGAGCHKSPQGLAKDRSQAGLSGFLREHYTNSRQSAAALASYIAGLPGGAAKPEPRQPRAAARPDESARPKPHAEREEAPRPEAKPPQKPPRGRQATVNREPPVPAAPPAAAPTPPEPPAAPPEPPKPQWDIFD